jgi:hypothetical protein
MYERIRMILHILSSNLSEPHIFFKLSIEFILFFNCLICNKNYDRFTPSIVVNFLVAFEFKIKVKIALP